MKPSLDLAIILIELSKNPNISQREIAVKKGISLGKVNYAIRSLKDKGLIIIQDAQVNRNKRYSYILTPKGTDEKNRMTSDFLTFKKREYERMRQEIEELQQEINVVDGHSLSILGVDQGISVR